MADPNLVPVVAPDGTPGYVPAAEVKDLVASHGRVMDPHEAEVAQKRADLETKYEGTVEGTVAPFAAGAARGASLGLSDYALGTFGGEGVRKRLLDYQDYAPGASLAGEIAGVAGSALVGNEAGVVGLAGKLGGAAERVVARGLGGGMLARGAGMAARGATEGALYSGGKALGDAAIQNEQLTTEKALAAIGHGALFGAGANVLLGGAGAGLSKLLSREEGAVSGLAGRVEGGAEHAAQRESTGLGDMLQKQADIKTIKALSGSAGDFRAMERNVEGGFRKVAQDVRGDIEATTGKSIGWHNKEGLYEYASQRTEELGDKLGGMLKKLDESGSGIAPDVKTFASKVHEELVAPHLVPQLNGASVVLPGQEAAVGAAQKWVARVEGAFGDRPPTFAQWQKMRRGLDGEINFASAAKDPVADSLKQVRAIMEKELETSGEAAAKNVGGAFADEYRATKSLFQSVRTAEELSLRGVSREMVNNGVGLRASMAGIGGVAAGHPVLGIAAGVGGMLVKDRGDMLAADLLHRAANLAGVQSLASRTDATISKGIAGLLGTSVPLGASTAAVVRVPAAPMGVALSGNLRGDYKKVSQAVLDAQANPVRTSDRVAKALGPEATRSPGVAMAATNLMLGDIDYLHKQMPPSRLDAFSLQPHLQKDTRASDSELSKWMQTAEVLSNPTMVLDEAKAGTLSRTHVEALKERRPEMFQAIRSEVLEQVVNTKKEIPYDARIQLGILLDIPTDRTLAPDFQQAIQATYSSAEQAGEESPPPQVSRPLAIASAFATPLVGATSEGLEK